MSSIKRNSNVLTKVVDSLYEGTYITFEKRRWDYWEIYSIKDGTNIGNIEYYKKWNKICFYPCNDTLYSDICLDDISQFIKDRNKEIENKINNN